MFIRRCVLAIAIGFQIERIAGQLSTTTGTWDQIGGDIDAVGDSGYNSGSAVALAMDGKTVAIGSPGSNGGAYRAGSARVYNVDSRRQWTTMGNDIIGRGQGDEIGLALAMSANGNMIVTGGMYETANVVVMRFNTTSHEWKQVGSDIVVRSYNNANGKACTMSADGTIVAVAGFAHIRVYKLNVSTQQWEQIGSDIESVIDSSSPVTRQADSLAMSADGSTLVVGTPTSSISDDTIGQVKVHKYSSSTKQWQQIGKDIQTNKKDRDFGNSVTMSADGATIAITSTSGRTPYWQFTIHCQVFQYSTESKSWDQVGADIDDSGGPGGYSIDMSADGKTIAFGSGDFTTVYAFQIGHTRVFTYSGNVWRQVGANITGVAPGDRSGSSVALSADGTTLAVGAPGYSTRGSFGVGHVRVYEFKPTTTDCTMSWNLYNSMTDKIVAPLVNGSFVATPLPCNQTNIEAIIPCDSKGLPLPTNTAAVLELYNGTKLIYRRNERYAKYFLFSNSGNNAFDGRIAAGTYMIRAVVNGTQPGPFTKFTLGGTCK